MQANTAIHRLARENPHSPTGATRCKLKHFGTEFDFESPFRQLKYLFHFSLAVSDITLAYPFVNNPTLMRTKSKECDSVFSRHWDVIDKGRFSSTSPSLNSPRSARMSTSRVASAEPTHKKGTEWYHSSIQLPSTIVLICRSEVTNNTFSHIVYWAWFKPLESQPEPAKSLPCVWHRFSLSKSTTQQTK